MYWGSYCVHEMSLRALPKGTNSTQHLHLRYGMAWQACNQNTSICHSVNHMTHTLGHLTYHRYAPHTGIQVRLRLTASGESEGNLD